VTEPEKSTTTGEVYLAPRKFNYARTIPEALGKHYCGTDDEWFYGEVWDPTRPPMLYQPNHLPMCCLAVEPIGLGGGVGNWSSPYAIGDPYPPEGGGVGNWSSPYAIGEPYVPEGGGTGNESSPWSIAEPLVTSGGGAGNWSSPWFVGDPLVPEGGGVGNWSSPWEIFESAPTPGASCEAAPAMSEAINYVWPADYVTSDAWWVFGPVEEGTEWHVTGSGFGSGVRLEGLFGDSCAGLSVVLAPDGVWTCASFVAPSDGYLWLRVTVLEVGGAVTIEIGPGPCV
jgi:hypothetical protein